MTTIVKFTITLIFSMLFVSCVFNTGVKGNGNVTTTERTVTEDFTKIEVARGLDVYITQTDDTSISVEADENLQDLITTEINNSILKITATENIGTSKSKKVLVDVENIELISSSSGSDVYTSNTIKAENLKLQTSSGADLVADVATQNLECDSSSGSDIKVSGKTSNISANASSGSDINARDLVAENGSANASSGSDISVNVTKRLDSKSSSGGDIRNVSKN
ncbi:MAG: head GIN domain-containing protein [Bacteroidota bacterium]